MTTTPTPASQPPALDRTDYSRRVVQTNTAAIPGMVYVCSERDIECGRNPKNWCAKCPQFDQLYAKLEPEQPSPARSDKDAEPMFWYDPHSTVVDAPVFGLTVTKEKRGKYSTPLFAGEAQESAPSSELSVEAILEIVAENTGKRASLSNGDLDCYIAVVRAALARRATAGTTAAPSRSIDGPEFEVALLAYVRALTGSNNLSEYVPAKRAFIDFIDAWSQQRATAGNAEISKLKE